MKKKLISLTLTALMAMTMAACGTEPAESAGNSVTEPATESTQEASAKVEEGDEADTNTATEADSGASEESAATESPAQDETPATDEAVGAEEEKPELDLSAEPARSYYMYKAVLEVAQPGTEDVFVKSMQSLFDMDKEDVLEAVNDPSIALCLFAEEQALYALSLVGRDDGICWYNTEFKDRLYEKKGDDWVQSMEEWSETCKADRAAATEKSEFEKQFDEIAAQFEAEKQ